MKKGHYILMKKGRYILMKKGRYILMKKGLYILMKKGRYILMKKGRYISMVFLLNQLSSVGRIYGCSIKMSLYLYGPIICENTLCYVACCKTFSQRMRISDMHHQMYKKNYS